MMKTWANEIDPKAEGSKAETNCRQSSVFLQHHYQQAMAGFFLTFMLFLAACVFESAECLVAVAFPGLVWQLVDRFGSALPYLEVRTSLTAPIRGSFHRRL